MSGPVLSSALDLASPEAQASGNPRAFIPVDAFARLKDYAGRGVITTSTYEARALGVFSAMGTMKAAKLAPDAVLLLTLGRLCARQELWGKAQSYLDASISVEPMYSAYLVLAQLHDRLGNADAARRNYRESLDLAVNQLKQMTGGRRRMSL